MRPLPRDHQAAHAAYRALDARGLDPVAVLTVATDDDRTFVVAVELDAGTVALERVHLTTSRSSS